MKLALIGINRINECFLAVDYLLFKIVVDKLHQLYLMQLLEWNKL